MIYVGWYRPFIFSWMNWLELVNENLVVYTTYFHFLYSDGFILMQHPMLDDMVKDTEMTNEVARGHVYLIGLIVAINMLLMLIIQGKTIFKKVKLCFIRRKYRKSATKYAANSAQKSAPKSALRQEEENAKNPTYDFYGKNNQFSDILKQ